jgi:hypothetical protein
LLLRAQALLVYFNLNIQQDEVVYSEKPCLWFIREVIHLNTELRKILNARNLTLGLTWDH